MNAGCDIKQNLQNCDVQMLDVIPICVYFTFVASTILSNNRVDVCLPKEDTMTGLIGLFFHVRGISTTSLLL